jgi:hypothetical protein
MTIDRITDHAALAIARLAEQYKNKPRFVGMLDAVSTQTQELEDVIHAMFLNRSYANAEGDQLDKVGEVVGVDRIPGELDAAYRVRIAEQVAENTGFGTPENIIALIAFLTSAALVELREIFPAAVVPTIDGLVLDEIADEIVAAVQSLLPAGVKLAYMVQGGDDDAFAFDGGGGLGFGDRFDDTIGGKFASLLGSYNAIEFEDPTMPSKNTTVTFTAETTKDIDVSVFGLNAQKCGVTVLDTLTGYPDVTIGRERPDINTVRLTSGSPITKTFRVLLLQAQD